MPEIDFPHENDTQEMHLGWQYLRYGILKVAAKRSMPWILAAVACGFGFVRFL